MLMIFLGIVLGLVFIVAIADNQAPLTNTRSVTNGTVTFPENGSTLTLEGQAVVGNVVVYNGTDLVASGNYSVADLVETTGGYRAVLTVIDEEFENTAVNVSYTYEPVGYNSSGANRTVLGLVLIFFALAVFAIALPGVREWITSFK
jgi:hypothetical protein